MVRNVTGGKKAKQSGHKAFTPSRMKISTDPSECYAIVTKMTGGRICLVKCQDKEERLCHIRGAFSGKFKGGNFIKAGVWVLVGLREWASKTEGKQESCDLLYVYSGNPHPEYTQSNHPTAAGSSTERLERRRDGYSHVGRRRAGGCR